MTASRATIVQACDSPRLFGFELWPRQRDLLAAADEGAARIHVWALGRRSGKTTIAALACLHDCLLRPDLDELVRPGERRYAVAVATNLRQARLIVSAARSVVERSPLLKRFVESASEDELRFTNSTTLAAFPCSSRGGRGWPISTLVLDEAAHFVSETDGYQTAERVWEALVPSTAQFGERARVIVASTPYGQDGLFAELWHKADAGELEDAVAARFATGEVNPTIAAAFLARERLRDPDSFRAEYGAEFVGSGSAYLDPERLAATVADRGELPASAGTHWVAGLDPAFSSDPFGLAIVGRDIVRPDRLVVALARSWRPQHGASYEERRLREDELLAEVADVCRDYRVGAVKTDQYAAPAIVERLQRAGLHVESIPMTATSKTAAFAELRAKLYTGELELYDHPELIGELRRLRSKFTAGSAAVVNPRVGGSHGDMAQALALAVYEYAPAGRALAIPSVTVAMPSYGETPIDSPGWASGW